MFYICYCPWPKKINRKETKTKKPFIQFQGVKQIHESTSHSIWLNWKIYMLLFQADNPPVLKQE